MTCEEVRLALGAHALGALEPDEAMEIDTHLATCEACVSELMELEGVTAFLGKVSERDVELVSSPPRQVLDRMLTTRARRNRRGRLLLTVAASAAVLAIGGTVWTTTQARQDSGATSQAAPEARKDTAQQPYLAAETPSAEADARTAKTTTGKPMPSSSTTGREFPGENEARNFYATVVAFPARGGTQLNVSVRNIPIGTTCSLVVYGKNGQKDTTESWVVHRETYAQKTVFGRQTTIPLDSIRRFEVVDAAGRTLVKIPRT